MNILIVSATHFEVKPLMDLFQITATQTGLYHGLKSINKTNIDVLITGIGMVNTASMLGRNSSKKYDLVLNVGVCGSFQKSIPLGEVVHITKDILSEMGAEDGDNFLTYDQLNLPGQSVFCNNLIDDAFSFNTLKNVKGITVNTVHGNDSTINSIKKLYNPDVESMEGAAFFAVCLNEFKNYTQIRAVSNYVEKRNKDNWQMTLAIKNLNEFLITFIENN